VFNWLLLRARDELAVPNTDAVSGGSALVPHRGGGVAPGGADSPKFRLHVTEQAPARLKPE